MPIYIGQLTSEVRSLAPAPASGGEAEGDDENRWEKGPALASLIARADRDRLRTATGYGHD